MSMKTEKVCASCKAILGDRLGTVMKSTHEVPPGFDLPQKVWVYHAAGTIRLTRKVRFDDGFGVAIWKPSDLLDMNCRSTSGIWYVSVRNLNRRRGRAWIELCDLPADSFVIEGETIEEARASIEQQEAVAAAKENRGSEIAKQFEQLGIKVKTFRIAGRVSIRFDDAERLLAMLKGDSSVETS